MTLRVKDGVPVVSDFASSEPPLVEDFSTGVLYTINENDEVLPVDLSPYDIRRFGEVGISAGNSQQSVFEAAIAAANGHPVIIPKDTYFIDDKISVTSGVSVVLHAEPGTIIRKTSASNGIRIEPTAVFTGTLASTQTDRGEAVVSGAAFTTDQYVNYWAQISTFFNAKQRLQKILITANTATTLTLRFDTGIQALIGDAIKIFPPTAVVEIRNIELDGDDLTGAGLLVFFADKLVLDNFDSHGHGQDPDVESNCITINSCRKVRLYAGETRDGLLGVFVYNTDDAIVFAHESSNASFQTTYQFKDCRNSRFVMCSALGGVDNDATAGYDIRASGLHPSYDCKVVNCLSADLDQQGALIHSLATEGMDYGIPYAFAVENLHTIRCLNGPMMAVQTPAAGVTDYGMTDSYLSECYTEDSDGNGARAQGLAGQVASNIEIRDCHSARCVDRSFYLEDWNDVRITRPVSENPGWGVTGHEPGIRLTNCLRTFIESPHFIISDANADQVQCLQETGTSDYTTISDPTIDDNQAMLTLDMSFAASNSKSFGVQRKGINSLTEAQQVTRYSQREVMRGAGSPEGAVTATIGTLFERTDGSVGTTLYIKESGTGNTGWVPVSSGPSGVWTPTLTNVANLDGSTAFECQYAQSGSTVTASGKVSVNPTTPATLTQLGISLPVASNLGAQEDCAGVAFASGIAGQGAAIRGDAANNRAEMAWIAGDVTDQPMYFQFQYSVI